MLTPRNLHIRSPHYSLLCVAYPRVKTINLASGKGAFPSCCLKMAKLDNCYTPLRPLSLVEKTDTIWQCHILASDRGRQRSLTRCASPNCFQRRRKHQSCVACLLSSTVGVSGSVFKMEAGVSDNLWVGMATDGVYISVKSATNHWRLFIFGCWQRTHKSVCRKPMEIGETSVEITEHSNIKTNLQLLIIMSQ